MPSLRRSLLTGLALTGSALALAQSTSRVTTPAPVKDYTVSFFSDEGYPWVRVIGATADLRVENQVTLGDTTIEVYSGTADRIVETLITAPVAVLTPEDQVINGPDTVQLEQPDLTVRGEDWTYEYLGPHEHRITIRRNAHLTFNQPMVDLIK